MENEDSNTQYDWLHGVFPPTYTAEEIINVSDEDRVDPATMQHLYSNVYSQVILEEGLQKKKLHSKSVNNAEKLARSKIAVTDSQRSKREHLWSAEDTKVFKEAYMKLKERAVKLLCIIESKNLKISDLKYQSKEEKKRLKLKDKLLSDVVKENNMLQEYVKTHQKITSELESKLQFYEDCNNDLQEIIQKKNEDLKKTRSELQNVCKMNKSITKMNESINKVKENHTAELITANESLSAQYACQINTLKKEVDILILSNKARNMECEKYKSGFTDLQRHFFNVSISALPNPDIIQEREFLGIADFSS